MGVIYPVFPMSPDVSLAAGGRAARTLTIRSVVQMARVRGQFLLLLQRATPVLIDRLNARLRMVLTSDNFRTYDFTLTLCGRHGQAVSKDHNYIRVLIVRANGRCVPPIYTYARDGNTA